MRRMVATLTLTGVLGAGVAVAATTAVAQDDVVTPEADESVSAEALVDRLVELESQLPALPPSTITLDPLDTWGSIEGDFLGAFTELDLIEPQARQLFVDADELGGPVGSSVAVVARGYLRLRSAYEDLARYEEYDLARPLATRDGDDVATGADEAQGLVEATIPLIVRARAEATLGYAALRDVEQADDSEKALFDAAYRDNLRFMEELRPDAYRLISRSTTSVLVAVERFEAGVGEARAKTVQYLCIPREIYPVDAPDPVLVLTAALAEGGELLDNADCPDLATGDNQVSVDAG